MELTTIVDGEAATAIFWVGDDSSGTNTARAAILFIALSDSCRSPITAREQLLGVVVSDPAQSDPERCC